MTSSLSAWLIKSLQDWDNKFTLAPDFDPCNPDPKFWLLGKKVQTIKQVVEWPFEHAREYDLSSWIVDKEAKLGAYIPYSAWKDSNISGFERGLTQALGGIFLIKQFQFVFGQRPKETDLEPRLYMLINKLEYIGGNKEYEKEGINKDAALDPTLADYRLHCRRMWDRQQECKRLERENQLGWGNFYLDSALCNWTSSMRRKRKAIDPLTGKLPSDYTSQESRSTATHSSGSGPPLAQSRFRQAQSEESYPDPSPPAAQQTSEDITVVTFPSESQSHLEEDMPATQPERPSAYNLLDSQTQNMTALDPSLPILQQSTTHWTAGHEFIDTSQGESPPSPDHLPNAEEAERSYKEAGSILEAEEGPVTQPPIFRRPIRRPRHSRPPKQRESYSLLSSDPSKSSSPARPDAMVTTSFELPRSGSSVAPETYHIAGANSEEAFEEGQHQPVPVGIRMLSSSGHISSSQSRGSWSSQSKHLIHSERRTHHVPTEQRSWWPPSPLGEASSHGDSSHSQDGPQGREISQHGETSTNPSTVPTDELNRYRTLLNHARRPQDGSERPVETLTEQESDSMAQSEILISHIDRFFSKEEQVDELASDIDQEASSNRTSPPNYAIDRSVFQGSSSQALPLQQDERQRTQSRPADNTSFSIPQTQIQEHTGDTTESSQSQGRTVPALDSRHVKDKSFQFPSHPSDSSQPALDLLSSSPGRSHNAQTRISHSPGHQSRVTIISDSTNASDSQELADVAPAPKVDLRPGHSQNANDEICLQRDRDHVPEISGIQVNDSRPWPPVDPNSEAYTRSAQKQPHSSIQPLKRLRSLASYSGDAEINHKHSGGSSLRRASSAPHANFTDAREAESPQPTVSDKPAKRRRLSSTFVLPPPPKTERRLAIKFKELLNKFSR